MNRVNAVLKHAIYQEQFQKLQEAEKNRIFCNHAMEHFLDVARLMYIYNLENGTAIPREIIYAAAFLHDIGRYEQYQNGTPHDIAGARLAGKIMKECGFSEDEIEMVQFAVLGHRQSSSEKRMAQETCNEQGKNIVQEDVQQGKNMVQKDTAQVKSTIQEDIVQSKSVMYEGSIMKNENIMIKEKLAEYLYCADKKSRNCFSCAAFDECNWTTEKRNMDIDR